MAAKKHKRHKRSSLKIPLYILCFLWLTEGEFAGAALFVFKAASHFQQPIKHLRTFSAASGELRVCLFVHVLQAVEFICDVERGEDRDFQRVDGEGAGRDLSHPAVDEFSQLNDVFGITIRPDVVGLIINLNSNRRTAGTGFILPLLIMRPIPELI